MTLCARLKKEREQNYTNLELRKETNTEYRRDAKNFRILLPLVTRKHTGMGKDLLEKLK